MLKSTAGLCAIILMLSGCNALRPEAQSRDIIIGDCLNGAVMNQASFGGPVRCGPQSEPVSAPNNAAPES